MGKFVILGLLVSLCSIAQSAEVSKFTRKTIQKNVPKFNIYQISSGDAGFIVYTIARKQAKINKIFVELKSRKKGIGRSLIKAAIEHIQENKINDITLLADPASDTIKSGTQEWQKAFEGLVHHFYPKCGFVFDEYEYLLGNKDTVTGALMHYDPQIKSEDEKKKS